MTRRTKIVATVGPASRDPEVMEAMIDAGANVLRLALAHTPTERALELHAQIREIAERKGIDVATMVDLPGPVVRTGFAPEEGIELMPGESIRLTVGHDELKPGEISVGYPNLLNEIVVGDSIHIGETAVLSVIDIVDGHINATVTTGGALRGRSAVEVPVRSFRPGALDEHDRADLDAFVAAGVDIAVITARTGNELKELNLARPPEGPLLIAKLQSMAAIENLHSLAEAADGMLIDRGALGLQAKLEELPHIQKQVIEESIAGGLPVITASQMLDSMITAPVPTRAETTDISNAIFDGTSALMLAAETAVGNHPVEVVETMAKIAELADDRFDHGDWTRRVQRLRMTGGDEEATITDAMTIGAARTAESLGLKTMICISASGFTVRSMARFRPKAQILGVSRHAATARQLCSSWGVTPVQYASESNDYAGKVDEAIAACHDRGLVEDGELVGVVAGITSANRATDTFRIVRVGDNLG